MCRTNAGIIRVTKREPLYWADRTNNAKWVQLINENETSQVAVRRGILSLASRLLSVQ